MTALSAAAAPATVRPAPSPQAAAGAAATCPARAGWRVGTPATDARNLPVVNWLGVGPEGRLRWNGVAIEADQAALYLDIVATMQPLPHMMLAGFDGASCVRLAEAAAFVEHHYDCAAGGCWLADRDAPLFRPPPAPPPPLPPPPRR